MKKIVALLALAFVTLSFTNLEGGKEIKTSESKVTWKGYKVTGSHEGTISVKSGSLSFEGEKLVGGNVVIDMTSIVVTDLSGGMKGNLEGHLKSDDFFGVEVHSTAILAFKSVEVTGGTTYKVTADLTIKGKTNPIDFEISVNGNKATASLKIDRTKYGIKYKSASFIDNLKNKAIYDEFDIVADLVF